MKWVYEKRKYILFLALAVWMGLIFGFSHQKAAQSSEISGTITYRVAEGINEVFALDWEEETLKGYAKAWQHPVRKAAHMTEYAVLACIFLANAVQYPRWKKRVYLWGWLGATVYAATDEFHQLFIEGRSGEVKDVGIDSLGAFLGMAAAWLVIWIWGRLYKSSNRIKKY